MKKSKFRQGSLVLLFLFFGSVSSFAHPHIVVDYSVRLVQTSSGGLTGIRVTWLFDPLFSQEVIFEVDRNRDQVLQSGEIEMVYSFAFQSTAFYNYFTRFQIDSGDIIFPTEVRDFHARIEGRRLAYEFTLPLAENQANWTPTNSKLSVWIYDETFFSAFIPKDPPFEGNSLGFQTRFFKDEARVITYDSGDLGTRTTRTNPDKIEFIRP